MKLVTSIKRAFYGFLGFFGLIDEHRQLSRTNVILYIFVFKFATVQLAVSNMADLAGAVVALGGVGGAMGLYAFKKNIASKAEPIADSVIDKIRNKSGEDPTKE